MAQAKAKAKFKYAKKAKVTAKTSGNTYTRYWYAKASTSGGGSSSVGGKRTGKARLVLKR